MRVSDSDLAGSDAISHNRRKGFQRVAFQIDALVLRPGVSDSDPKVPAPQGLNHPLGKLPLSRNKQDDKFIAHSDGFELIGC